MSWLRLDVVSTTPGSPRCRAHVYAMPDVPWPADARRRPVQRVTGRVANRPPDRGAGAARASAACPVRFRLACWWTGGCPRRRTTTTTPDRFLVGPCEHCGKKSAAPAPAAAPPRLSDRRVVIVVVVVAGTAAGTSTRRWNPTRRATSAWNWNGRPDNTPRTRADTTWGSVRGTLCCSTSTTSVPGSYSYMGSRTLLRTRHLRRLRRTAPLKSPSDVLAIPDGERPGYLPARPCLVSSPFFLVV